MISMTDIKIKIKLETNVCYYAQDKERIGVFRYQLKNQKQNIKNYKENQIIYEVHIHTYTQGLILLIFMFHSVGNFKMIFALGLPLHV